MNVLFAWPEDDLIELDEFEMNLGFHHVDTNTAGKKHAMAFKPSGDFVFGIVQEGVVSLPAPYETKCDNYSRYLHISNYRVRYSKEVDLRQNTSTDDVTECGCTSLHSIANGQFGDLCVYSSHLSFGPRYEE
ncbi:hypothetical protein V5799_006409 [Amblyomma americanum]|uniref:Uncharacterized protein n=1 Tax=Amblyomma americanum TaxID=6943 RepID=A0AAQ4DWG8_AMBAM